MSKPDPAARPERHPASGEMTVVPHVLVREVMTPHVRTIGRRHSAREVVDLMRDRHIQHVIVVDAAGRVCGVVSDRDVRSAAPSTFGDAKARADALGTIRVEELMAVHPVTVRPTDDVTLALRLMRQHKIGCLAVVDELGTAIGIVTGYDVLTLALDLLERRR